IRSAFNLSGLMPGDAQVEQARQSMSGPSIKLMQTVAGAIREDLARVKDVLDIFVRTGMERVEELAPQLDLLKKIGDTLGVLGLGELREIVQTRREELQDLISGARRAEENTLVSIAAALLGVEDRLEGDLIGMITARTDEPTVVSLDVPAERGPDLNQVTPAVVRECLVNLARVKEAVAQATDRRGEAGAIDLVPELLRGITAGLMMLGKERAAGVVESLQKAIAALLREDGQVGQVGQGGRGSPGSDSDHRMDRLADATVSLEYYLETLQAGRSDPNYMLDNAERCLAGLVSSQPRQPAGILAGLDSLDEAATVAATPPEYEATQVLSRPPAPPEPEEPTLVFSGGRERLDPELLELFIEEARDEIANIGRDYPAWERDDADGNALASLRRSFHTLKGSGRMVGADRIGECCWHVERVFNRLIDGTLRRNPHMLALLQRAISVVPELLEELETGSPPRADLPALIAELRALTEAPRQAEVAEEAVETAGESALEPESAAAPGTQPAETSPADQPQAEPAPAPAAITAPASRKTSGKRRAAPCIASAVAIHA
ncbi:MAG: Hpt domain-containing protein, partial [Gammaproteobacteria bacterium]|nr:Hpt domain-containing protein [Gammaproteobacteria bacterium]